MRHRIKHDFRRVVCAMLCLEMLISVGCTCRYVTNTKNNSDLADLSFLEPNLLYLHGNQCQRLYVEVDTVKGSEPDAETIYIDNNYIKKSNAGALSDHQG